MEGLHALPRCSLVMTVHAVRLLCREICAHVVEATSSSALQLCRRLTPVSG